MWAGSPGPPTSNLGRLPRAPPPLTWAGSPGPTPNVGRQAAQGPLTCSSCCGTCCSCPGQSGTPGRWQRRRRSGCLRPSTPTRPPENSREIGRELAWAWSRARQTDPRLLNRLGPVGPTVPYIQLSTHTAPLLTDRSIFNSALWALCRRQVSAQQSSLRWRHSLWLHPEKARPFCRAELRGRRQRPTSLKCKEKNTREGGWA